MWIDEYPRKPICAECEERIKGEKAHWIGDRLLCEDCFEYWVEENTIYLDEEEYEE